MSQEHGEISKLFSQFGKTGFVYWHQINQAQYGFVQFRSSKDAKSVLQHSDHRIGTTVVHILAAKPWHQPDYPFELKGNWLAFDTNYMQSTTNYGNVCGVPLRTLFITSNKPIVSITFA